MPSLVSTGVLPAGRDYCPRFHMRTVKLSEGSDLQLMSAPAGTRKPAHLNPEPVSHSVVLAKPIRTRPSECSTSGGGSWVGRGQELHCNQCLSWSLSQVFPVCLPPCLLPLNWGCLEGRPGLRTHCRVPGAQRVSGTRFLLNTQEFPNLSCKALPSSQTQAPWHIRQCRGNCS